LAGLAALCLFTLGAVPHAPLADSAHGPVAAVVQAAQHGDQTIVTRSAAPHVTALKTPATYGGLAVAGGLLALCVWLLAVGRGRGHRPRTLDRGSRLSRAPPLTA
jgi:hypothetical protein